MNRFTTKKLDDAIAAQAGASITNGIEGPRWKGCDVAADFALANVTADEGLCYTDAFVEEQDTAISKIVSIKTPATFIAAKANYIQVPLSSLGFSEKTEIIGAYVIGKQSIDTNEATEAYFTNNENGYFRISKVRNVLIIEALEGQTTLSDISNVILNVMIHYR